MAFKDRLRNVGAAGLIGLASLLSTGKSADAATIRVRSDSPINQNGNYTVYVEAENSGLSEIATNGVQWRLNAPSYFDNWIVSPPVDSADFFGGMGGDIDSGLSNPNGPSWRTNYTDKAPIDQPIFKQLAVYDFTVNYTGPLPVSDSLMLTDIMFAGVNGGEPYSQEPITVKDYSFTITPEPTTMASALLGGIGIAALGKRRKAGKLETKVQ